MWDPDTVTPAGKTLGQIDQEQKLYVEEANRALEDKWGYPVQWWGLVESSPMCSLVVGDLRGEDNLVLSFTPLDKIENTTDWKNQHLTVIWTSAPPSEKRGWKFELRDQENGFSMICNTFSWSKDRPLAKQ